MLPQCLKLPWIVIDGRVRKWRDPGRIALASFPRSGNTWLRDLIEATTGEKTGSIYWEDIGRRTPRGIVIKTHMRDSAVYHRAVHLVRHPFDAIDSFYHYRRQIAGRDGLAWDKHVVFASRWWCAHTKHWLTTRRPTHLMTYEKLKSDPVDEMDRLLQWLDRPTDREAITKAVDDCQINRLREKHRPLKGDRTDKFFRHGKVGKGAEAFSPEEKRIVKSLADPWLKRLGYPPIDVDASNAPR
jgi:uncharacterized protein (DUF2384 family)